MVSMCWNMSNPNRIGATVNPRRSRQKACRVAGCPHSTSLPLEACRGVGRLLDSRRRSAAARTGRVAWACAPGLPFAVAATHVLLGVQYPSDLLAGLLLGRSWAGSEPVLGGSHHGGLRDLTRPKAGLDVPLEAGLGPDED